MNCLVEAYKALEYSFWFLPTLLAPRLSGRLIGRFATWLYNDYLEEHGIEDDPDLFALCEESYGQFPNSRIVLQEIWRTKFNWYDDKACGCGRVYSHQEWEALYQEQGKKDAVLPGYQLALATCPKCKSTMGKEYRG